MNLYIQYITIPGSSGQDVLTCCELGLETKTTPLHKEPGEFTCAIGPYERVGAPEAEQRPTESVPH